ncbi:hypothetical protein ACG3SL_02565 [Sphingomonas sp. CJ20]
MKMTLGRLIAETGALWRSERALLVPLAGVFFFLPMLGTILLLASSGFPGEVQPEQLRAALETFYTANLVPILLVNLALDFGTFAVLNLFLQGGGRTLGEVLGIALRRFLPFLVLGFFTGLLFGIGLSLFVLPGVFLFLRTWLAGPAYAAVPEAGMLAALRSGWRQTAGLGWITLLAAASLIMLAALLAIFVSTLPLGLAAKLAGAGVVTTVSYVVAALIGGVAWLALAILRVAAYRLSAPSNGT